MRIYDLFLNYFIMIIMYLSGFFIQNISNINKKSVFYGIRVPVGYEKDEKLIQLHKKYQKNYNVSFLIMIIILTFIIMNVSEEISVLLIIPETFLSLAIMALNYLLINRKTKLLKQNEGWSFLDDDQYYKYGLIYYNKNDPALFVEKRNGIGTTLNFARPAAKIFMSILAAIIIVPLLAMFIFLPGMTKERQIDINENTIKIYGTWGPIISKDEINKIDIEYILPKIMLKTNGADINKKLFGMHRLEGYSNSALFLGDKTKPFVAIYLKNGSLVLINYVDENKTKSLLTSITSIMNIR